MAFSLQAFGAGFASTMANTLTEQRQRQERLQDEATSLATRQRLAKQAKRDEEKKIMEELTESLSLYYTPDQVQNILSEGKAGVQYALNHAQNLPVGVDASTTYTLPKTNVLSKHTYDPDNPSATNAPSISEGVLGKGTFASRFTAIDPKAKTKATTFQARLVELDFEIQNAKTQEEKDLAQEAFNLTSEAYKNFKSIEASKANKDGKTVTIDFLDETRQQSIIDNSFDSVLKPYIDLYEVDPATQLKKLKTGNQAAIIQLQAQNYINLKETYLTKDSDGKALVEEGDTFFSRIKQVGQAANRDKRNYVNEQKLKQTTLEATAAQNNTSVASTSTTYYVNNPAEPRTLQDVQKGMRDGTFNMGSAVEYVDENGALRTALVSVVGVYP